MADVQALIVLENQSFSADRLSRKAFRNAIQLERQVILVAVDDNDQPIGYAMLHFRKAVRHAVLHSIAVAPGHRGHGVGRDLLAAAEAEAASRGAPAVRLFVAASDSDAQEFHRRHGYSSRKIVRSHFPDGADAVQMERLFSPTGQQDVPSRRLPSIVVVVGRQQDRKPLEELARTLNFRLATASEYLSKPDASIGARQIINLCPVEDYLSQGYYVSLLAKARAHRATPNIDTVTGLIWKKLYKDYLSELTALVIERLPASIKDGSQDKIAVETYFGHAQHEWARRMAARAWRLFPAPILEILLVRHKDGWRVDYIWPLSIASVQPEDMPRFHEALAEYCQNRRNPVLRRKRTSFDLAILFDPKEKFPPSTEQAIKLFIRAADSQNIQAEIIGRKDLDRVSSFDALFIRETTNIDNHTFTFSRAAEAAGIPVIDDPVSILRCSNKVYLHEAMTRAKIATPKTVLITRANLKEMQGQLTYPTVLKIPDGSFSRGVVKVKDPEEFQTKAGEMLEDSYFILAQEFLPTEFDWRIGILDGKALFACKYHMARGHWQVYDHASKKKVNWGPAETVDIAEAPQHVVKAAVRASLQMGRSLYGVDMKDVNGTPYVIEVNDNPNLDNGVEDGVLGDALYNTVITVFRNRILASKGLLAPGKQGNVLQDK